MFVHADIQELQSTKNPEFLHKIVHRILETPLENQNILYEIVFGVVSWILYMPISHAVS